MDHTNLLELPANTKIVQDVICKVCEPVESVVTSKVMPYYLLLIGLIVLSIIISIISMVMLFRVNKSLKQCQFSSENGVGENIGNLDISAD